MPTLIVNPSLAPVASGAQDTPIELERAGRGRVPVEPAALLQPLTAMVLGEGRVVEHALDAVGDRLRVERVHERGRPAGHLLERGAARADDGKARRHRVGDGKAEALLERG